MDWYEKYRWEIACSPRWKHLRELVKLRAGGQCEGFYHRDGAPLECGNVHHLHYDTLGKETVDDLLFLCRECHEQAERERKQSKPQSQPRQHEIVERRFGVIAGGRGGYRQRTLDELWKPAFTWPDWAWIGRPAEWKEFFLDSPEGKELMQMMPVSNEAWWERTRPLFSRYIGRKDEELRRVEAAKRPPLPDRAVLIDVFGVDFELSKAVRTTLPRHLYCYRETGTGRVELWLVHELDFDAQHWDGWTGSLSVDGYVKLKDSCEKKWGKQCG